MNRLLLAAAIALVSLPAIAQPAPPNQTKTFILSSALVEEIFQLLAKDPYASVASTVGKLQFEIQHQPPPTVATPPEPTPPEPK